jgi:antitoxin ParD1/3/4/toxin ParE1/3/4
VKRYLLTRPAATDLDEILDHIAGQSVQNAVRVATRLAALFDGISQTPGIGHRRDELRDASLRVVTGAGYLVIYDPTLTPLHILRVVRGSRDLRRVMPRP